MHFNSNTTPVSVSKECSGTQTWGHRKITLFICSHKIVKRLESERSIYVNQSIMFSLLSAMFLNL